MCHGEDLLDAVASGDGQSHTRWKSIVTQSFAASDIVRNSSRVSLGFVNFIVSQQMRADGASDRLFDLMGEFGISLSKATVRRDEYSKVEETIKAGVDMTKVSRYAIVFPLYDNAGFGMINLTRSSELRSNQKS